MKSIFLTLLAAAIVQTGAANCENGWEAYKDELCIKIFTTTFFNYDDAKTFCSSQGNEVSQASLVMVKESDMQEFLVAYTNDTFDYVWLGAKYDEGIGQFKWDDGETLVYSNWQEGYPRNTTDSEICVELRPAHAKMSTKIDGKWADATCQRHNAVMCQKAFTWSLQDAIDEIIRMRKEQETLARKVEELESVATRVVPIGFIYIEYNGQPSPRTIWPNLTWQDVTSTYAGLFFRASGDSSAAWGAIQEECAPRISEMSYSDRNTNFSGIQNPLNIPSSGLSEYGWSGRHFAETDDNTGMRLHYDALQFLTTGCEVRPKNQAIRIWKRTG